MEVETEKDVEMELDGDFMQKFSCLGTTDKDVLISEFQRLAGTGVNPTACAFFLDMNNWNLQAAICSYYDFENPAIEMPMPTMTFIQDITIGEGESVPPDTDFTKTWRVQNSGTEAWPQGSYLRFLQGHILGSNERQEVRSLQPQEYANISIQMHSPKECGLYQGQWRMCAQNGMFFGETIWVILEVKEGGLLGLTQQMSSMGSEDFSHVSPNAAVSNPFASSTETDLSDSINSIQLGGASNIDPSQSPVRPTLFQLPQHRHQDTQPPHYPINSLQPHPDFPPSDVDRYHHTNSQEHLTNHHQSGGNIS